MDLTGKISAFILASIFTISMLSPFMLSHMPDEIDLNSIRERPSINHLLGTDNKGRDILSRLLHGGRLSLSISIGSAALSMILGVAYGLIAGYAGGRTDTFMMAIVDLMLSFPSFLLAIGISVIFPPGIYTVIISLAAVGWASFARVIRGFVLLQRESLFVEAAYSIGCSHTRIIFLHILPQCIPLAIVLAGLKSSGFILAEAGLSFLGLGAQPPVATWGSMISSNRVFINSAPWMVLSPGIMIALTAICFNLLGDALNRKFDISH